MSGFFEVASIGEQPALPPVDVPILRRARGWVAGVMPGRAPVGRPHR
jgi:hypothetical protein